MLERNVAEHVEQAIGQNDAHYLARVGHEIVHVVLQAQKVLHNGVRLQHVAHALAEAGRNREVFCSC